MIDPLNRKTSFIYNNKKRNKPIGLTPILILKTNQNET